LRILGISGSLRRQSHNTKLLHNAEELLAPEVDFELWQDLKLVPPYDEEDDVEPAPPAVAALKHAITEADGIVFATPEYNSSVPGQLKNALDWASRPAGKSPLRNKPVAVIGSSTGAFGAVWAQAELRKVLAAAGARVVDAEVAVGHADSRFDEQGRLVDESFRRELAETLDTLVDAITARAPAADALVAV